MRKITVLMAMCLLAGCISVPAAKSDKPAVPNRIVLDGAELELRNCKELDEALQEECQATNDLFTARSENARVLKENEALKNELATAKKGEAKKPKERLSHSNVAMAAMVMPEPLPDPAMMADKAPPTRRSKRDGDLWIEGLDYPAGEDARVCLIRRGIPIAIATGIQTLADMDSDNVVDPVPYRCSTASGGIRIPAIEPGETVRLVYLTLSRYKGLWIVAEKKEYTGHRAGSAYNHQFGSGGRSLGN